MRLLVYESSSFFRFRLSFLFLYFSHGSLLFLNGSLFLCN